MNLKYVKVCVFCTKVVVSTVEELSGPRTLGEVRGASFGVLLLQKEKEFLSFWKGL